MRWASAISLTTDTLVACVEACDAAERQLSDAPADLVIAFGSPDHTDSWEQVACELGERFPSATVIGCSAGGVIGGGREVEAAPGFSLVAASLPDVSIHPFSMDDSDIPAPEVAAAAWTELLELDPAQDPAFILLPDPFTCDASRLIAGLDVAFPGQVKLGGLASGGTSAGIHRLLLDGLVRRSGVVGLALVGDVQVDTVVAQGCRPIGPELVVTAAQDNMILSLDGVPALLKLELVFSMMGEEVQEQFRQGPMLGVALKEGAAERDFIIRSLTGMDRASGVLKVGQTVRFHVLDAAAARDELDTLLQGCADEPSGALLFSCLGRGAGFFGQACHDTDLFHARVGGAPLGGFFCNGEIGPRHGRTWMHGYTSAFGLFRPRGWD